MLFSCTKCAQNDLDVSGYNGMDRAFKALTMCSSKMFNLCPYEPMNHICLCMFAPGRDGVSSADGMMHEQNSASSASTQRRSFPSREPRDAAPVVHNTHNSHNTRPGDKKHFTCHAAAPALRTLDTNTMDRNIIQQSHSSWLSVGVGRKKCPHHSPRLLSRASNEGLQRFHNRREAPTKAPGVSLYPCEDGALPQPSLVLVEHHGHRLQLLLGEAVHHHGAPGYLQGYRNSDISGTPLLYKPYNCNWHILHTSPLWSTVSSQLLLHCGEQSKVVKLVVGLAIQTV